MKQFITGLVLLTAACCRAQTPPNDDFTNRIHLAGSVACFTGDNVGGIWSEDPEEPYVCEWYSYRTIWWSWTAEESSAVIVERVGPYSEILGGISVFAGTNLVGIGTNRQCDIDFYGHGQRAVFNAQAGTEYPIAMSGSIDSPISIKLTATNAPMFRVQPRTQTISPGQSALLTSSAIGIKPLHYQWQRNGVDIPNATNQMLAFNDCSITNSGFYRVVVTNATGVSTSAVARLNVSTNETGPVLEALGIGSKKFQFRVRGEEARRYWIQYSTDMTDWSGPWTGSRLVFNTNGTTTIETSADSSHKFARASHYHATNEICVNNIRQLWFAIQEFADDQHKRNSDDVAIEYLIPYLADQNVIFCPSAPHHSYSSYTVADVQDVPNCMYVPEHHVLFDP